MTEPTFTVEQLQAQLTADGFVRLLTTEQVLRLVAGGQTGALTADEVVAALVRRYDRKAARRAAQPEAVEA